MTFKYIIAFLMIVAFILPSSAIVDLKYSDEYYRLGSLSTQVYNSFDASYVNGWNMAWASTSTAGSTVLSAIELRRQTILMEKQNELLFEQNALLRKLAGEPSGGGLIYYDKVAINSSYDYKWENCYQNETGQDPNDLVMHFTCPNRSE